MSRARLFKIAPLSVALVLSIGWVDSASVGPPWISLELPANPLDPTTRGAALVVHTFHHGTPIFFDISGTAEGLVNGERRSIELEFDQTSRTGVYAVKQQWPAEGSWVLAITTAGNADASLVVELGPDGGVHQTEYYDMPMKVLAIRSARVVAGGIDAGKIDAALQAMTATDD
jgi:hypothetical protein